MTNEITPELISEIASRLYNEIPGANLVPKTEADVHHLERDAQSSPPTAPDASERGVPSSPIGDSGLAGSGLSKSAGTAHPSAAPAAATTTPEPILIAGMPAADTSTGEAARTFVERLRSGQIHSDKNQCANDAEQVRIQRLFAGNSLPETGSRPLDVPTIRRDFPVLNQQVHGKPLVWFDNAATTQKPQSVIDAISRFYAHDNSNIHRGAHTLAARATDAFEGARQKAQGFLGASSAKEVVFVRGTTEGINLVAESYGGKFFQPGDEIVSSAHLYGGTVTQFNNTLKKLSVTVHWVDPCDLTAWERAITPKTRALYGETIGNPRGSILDLEALGKLAAAHRIPLVVDNTFATPYLCRPIDWGATIVVHSATKFIGGHGTSIGGAIVDAGTFDFSRFPTIADPSPSYHGLRFYDTFGHYGFLMKVRTETVRDTGACLSPMNAFFLLQGLETLSVRMDRHVENAQAVAKFLHAHPRVESVAYAGLPDHPDFARAQKYLPKGPGAVFSFELKPPSGNAREAGRKFIESLQLFSHLANVGDVRSLVIHPASTTHQQLSDEELRLGGVTPSLIRLSIGLETTEDLLWDLDQALHAISG